MFAVLEAPLPHQELPVESHINRTAGAPGAGNLQPAITLPTTAEPEGGPCSGGTDGPDDALTTA